MNWFRKPSSAPLWQDEFSVFTADERYVNRRQFTKFLTLTSFGMLVGNLWILARSVFHRHPDYPGSVVAAADEIAVGGVKLFTYPTSRRPVHSGAYGRRLLCGLQPEVHASLLRRLLRQGAATGSSAPATRASFRLPTVPSCKDRRHGLCRASFWKRVAISWLPLR